MQLDLVIHSPALLKEAVFYAVVCRLVLEAIVISHPHSLLYSPQGLADESEFIRDTSLQAGQTVVNRYADTAVELFLPELEGGLFDGNWRIR